MAREIEPNREWELYKYAPDLIDHLAKQGIEIGPKEGIEAVLYKIPKLQGRANIRPRFDLKQGTLRINIPEIPTENSDPERIAYQLRNHIAEEVKHAGQITDWRGMFDNPITTTGQLAADIIAEQTLLKGKISRYDVKGTVENIHKDPKRYDPILTRYGIDNKGHLLGKEPDSKEELYKRLRLPLPENVPSYKSEHVYLDHEGNLIPEPSMDAKFINMISKGAYEETGKPVPWEKLIWNGTDWVPEPESREVTEKNLGGPVTKPFYSDKRYLI